MLSLSSISIDILEPKCLTRWVADPDHQAISSMFLLGFSFCLSSNSNFRKYTLSFLIHGIISFVRRLFVTRSLPIQAIKLNYYKAQYVAHLVWIYLLKQLVQNKLSTIEKCEISLLKLRVLQLMFQVFQTSAIQWPLFYLCKNRF